MNIRRPKFCTDPVLSGMRAVGVAGCPGENWREDLPELFRNVKPEHLVVLTDQTEELDRREMYEFLKFATLKGYRFAHFVNQGFYPEWLGYLDHAIIEINHPKEFRAGDDFNRAVQALWFGRGKLHILCNLVDFTDLPMTELLYSYTPNDVDFLVTVCGMDFKARAPILVELLDRKFSTVRVILD